MTLSASALSSNTWLQLGVWHGSLEGVGMLKRHAVVHLKAEQLRIPNLPFRNLGKSVFVCNFHFCVTCSFISFVLVHGTCEFVGPTCLMPGQCSYPEE